MPDRYFEINDDVGIDADGNKEPAVEIGLSVSTPVMKGQELVAVEERTVIQPIAGTRIYKTDDESVADILAGAGTVHEIDPPKKADLDRQRSDTQDSREREEK
jgi:hypothetical protein